MIPLLHAIISSPSIVLSFVKIVSTSANQRCQYLRTPNLLLLLTVTICGDACPLSCASAEAYTLAQCTRPQGWGS